MPPAGGDLAGANGHRTVTYVSPTANRSFQQHHGARSRSTSMNTPITNMRHQNHSQQEVPDRSRSRSAARTASENLLVSLDEAVLPPQITTKNQNNTTAASSQTIHSARVMRREHGGDNGSGLLHGSTSPRQFDSVEQAAQGPSTSDKHAAE